MANERIFLSPPHMSGREQTLVQDAFRSNYIAPVGPMVDAFEKEFAEYTGQPFCLAVSSGTAAMHLALHCLGIGPGDVILASTLTFIGSVSPIIFLGATPVFIDCAQDTWNMDPSLLQEAIETLEREGLVPKAVVPTDIYGQCNAIDAIRDLCDPKGIKVVIDAAESVGARYQNTHAGCGADAAIYSFNGNKIITTSGGGMLASEDEGLIAHARKLSTQAREPLPYYEHEEIGYNYRMSNVLAAIGRGQLQILDERVRRKREIFSYYNRELGELPGISFMPEVEGGHANRWLTVMLIDPHVTRTTPEAIRLALEEENIESRPLWKPMHRQPVFDHNRVFGGKVSESLFDSGLCLPSGTAMSDGDLKRVVTAIREKLGT